MDIGLELLRKFGYAVVQLLLNPFWYVALLFLVLQYNRQIQLERKLFHARMHSLRGETLRAVLWGLLVGAAATLAMLPLGVQLTDGTVVLVLWGLALLLMLVRVRFLCLAYAVGALGILQAALSFLPEAAIGPIARSVLHAGMPGMLALVGVLHIAEGLLVAGQAARMASPMFFAGKRGKIVGGFSLQGFWPIPLFLLAPLAGGSDGALPWTPLFAGGDARNAGWTLIGLPIMLGYGELSTARLPQHKARTSALWLLGYGAVMLLLAAASHFWTPLTVVASVLSIALHEALIWRSRREEERHSPLFVYDARGLRILAVIPGGPAAEIGLETGEIIGKVNGMKVASRADLHEAIRLNPAFCKLEVYNLQGEIKFAQRAIYAGDHHSLGIILSPDQESTHYVEFRQPSFASFVRGILHSPRRHDSGEEL